MLVTKLGMIIQGTYFGSQEEYDSLGLEDKLPKSLNLATVELKDWFGVTTSRAEAVLPKGVGGTPPPFYSKSLVFRSDTLISSETIQ